MRLTIRDNSYRLSWGTGAFQIICDNLDITLNDVDFGIYSNDQKILNNLTYAALQNAAKIDEVEFNVNYWQFLEWLNEQPEEIGKDIINDYLDSVYLGKTMRQRYEEITAKLESDNEETTPKKLKKKTVRSEK